MFRRRVFFIRGPFILKCLTPSSRFVCVRVVFWGDRFLSSRRFESFLTTDPDYGPIFFESSVIANIPLGGLTCSPFFLVVGCWEIS